MSPNVVGVLAAELEHVPELDAARDSQRAAAAGTAVAVADLDRADLTVRREVPTADNVRGVPARLVRAGDPGRARRDQRIDEVADLAAASQPAGRCTP